MNTNKAISMFFQLILAVVVLISCEMDKGDLEPDIAGLKAAVSNYYVATTGSDMNPGTLEKPFASWQKAFTVVQAGQTVFIRGGVYYPNATKKNGVYIKDKSGTASNQIKIFAYPGENPVLDCSGMASGGNSYGIYLVNASYWHLKGLSITGVSQHGTKYMATGLSLSSGNNNIFELLKLNENEGPGLGIYRASENNLVLNCDSYDNYDPSTTVKGGNADGFAIAFITERNGNERTNTFVGCRAWNNSDDGYDYYGNEGNVKMDKCWAFTNGYEKGDGNGFKLGDTFGKAESTSQRDLTNCFAYKNSHHGFYQNFANMKMKLTNNISYKNVMRGFYFSNYNTEIIFTDNVSYSNGMKDTFMSNMKQVNNSWNKSVAVTDNTFISTDATGITGNRQADGSLPAINFLKLR